MMKASIRLALVSALIHTATAVVHFPFAKQTNNGHKSAASTVRRTVNSEIFWGDLSYVVNASVGTPGQSVSLLLSPSSTDTWVLDDRSDYCAYYYDYSSYDYDDDEDDDESTDVSTTTDCKWGTFASNVSSSYVPQDTDDDEDSSYYDYDFYETYDDGSYAYGAYFNDVITLGGATVSNFTMGLVNETDKYIGVLGIGYNDSTYSNLPDRLHEQGLINSTAYSIWVDDEQASSGNLLFGAIDTTKFEGTLSRVSSYYSWYKMTLEIASINGTTSKSGGPVSITYGDDDDDDDSSYTYSSDYMFTATFSPPDTVSNLPTEVASQIWDMAGAYYDSSVDLALISCTAANVTTTNFTLQLGRGTYGPIITATMADLVIPASDINMTSYSYYLSDDTNVCLFGVQNGTSAYSYSTSDYTLGSTFLRRTYSVFDLVNNEIAVAPVKFGATATSNIVPFETYGASVPSSTMHCVYSNCYETSDGTDSDDSESDGDHLPSGVLSVGALVGMTAGIGLGALALGIVGFLVWKRRRNNNNKNKDDKEAALLAAMAGGAATEPGAAPEMSEAASAAPAAGTGKGKGKGKAPEAPAPAALSSVEEHPEPSTAATADGAHTDAATTTTTTNTPAAQPSSSREV